MENEEEPSTIRKKGVCLSSLPDAKSPAKGLLKPLSSLRRSVSPAPGVHKITSDSRPNAFTALMQGNNLDKQWADAADNEAQPWKKGYIRPAPFYKILDGMTIAVDAFKYGKIPGVEAYFLS
jgi:DNA cross-link repair 1A protein